MSATTGGALKAHLESFARGVPWYRDRAPQDAVLPFGIIQEAISVVPLAMGDTTDQTAERVVQEEAQVTLYQVWRGADGKPAEQYPLAEAIYKDLQGARLATHPKQVSGVKVTGMVRRLEVDNPNGSAVRADTTDGANVVAHIYLLNIWRTA
jgi:hypothetical protein